jgi:signal transduction histidine kinase
MVNLINNAIDAMQPKKGILTISLAYTDSQAVLTIADNGVGMSEEHLNRIFEPYFTQKSKGLGLGLTITLNVIQAHKALLHVVSELHVGTTFQISFPLEGMG